MPYASCVDDGPGMHWARAMSSAKTGLENQLRRSAKSCRKGGREWLEGVGRVGGAGRGAPPTPRPRRPPCPPLAPPTNMNWPTCADGPPKVVQPSGSQYRTRSRYDTSAAGGGPLAAGPSPTSALGGPPPSPAGVPGGMPAGCGASTSSGGTAAPAGGGGRPHVSLRIARGPWRRSGSRNPPAAGVNRIPTRHRTVAPALGGRHGPGRQICPPCARGLAQHKGACPVLCPASLPRAAVGAQNAKKGGLPSPSGPLLPPPSPVMACLPVGECGRAGRPCPLSPAPASQETRKGGEGPAGGGRRTGRGRGRAGCRQGSPQP